MFDKLIVTEPEGADFRNRRSYFMASSLIVGILFITAVVISIYASDYGLGRDGYELSMIVAPPEIASPEPKPQQPRLPANSSQIRDSTPAKPSFVEPADNPQTVPAGISTSPQISTISDKLPLSDDTPGGRIGSGRDPGETGTGSVGIGNSIRPNEVVPIIEPPPPSVKKPAEEKPTILRSQGVINGKATYLPKPSYPAAATAINAQGRVTVQVTIDERGKVISANAISGHMLLKLPAEQAARQATFSPTYLSNVPVKVTGVIVYNFTR